MSRVCSPFRQAMDSALNDASLAIRSAATEPVRDDGSIFISISSYRDETCGPSLRRAFSRADRPELVSAGEACV